jgi:hypothetical protein
LTKAIAIVVGVLIWLPSLFLLSGAGISRGPSGWEFLSALCPVGAIGIPALVRASQNQNTNRIFWLIALGPLLVLVGACTAFAFEELVVGDGYNRNRAQIGALVNIAAWGGIGLIIHLLRSRKRVDA